jgi:crotonobetainyl-CoA:carnitine CoA-transferase CaiB-like acyl-CoA transferase
MTSSTPLAGLRVLESVGWNGVLAGRLLADGGADVIRVIPPSGDLMDSEPPFFGTSGVSIQSAWYNAGKRLIQIDLSTEQGLAEFRTLAGATDMLLEDWPQDGAPLSVEELRLLNPRLTRVSITPAAADGPWSKIVVSDIVQNALSGSASVTGNAETSPISGYGNQSFHTVGLYVAVCALAAQRAAARTGVSQHVVLSAHEALVTCTEQVLMQWFFPEWSWSSAVAPRQGSLHWSRAYEVYQGRTGGGIMVTAALNFVQSILPWLKEEDAAQMLADEEKYPDVMAMIMDLPYVMEVMKEWVARHDAEELFYEAQRRHQPFGVVWNIEQALTRSPQIEGRAYLQPRDVAGFGTVPFPGRIVSTEADGPHPEPPVTVRVDDLSWGQRQGGGVQGAVASHRPLEGVRIMDFTHVLAGPFGTRVLGDLGADVLKIGTASRNIGANTAAHPYYICWNRNKRSVALNMALDEGRDLARRLAAKCDVITENFSAGVLKRWGLDRQSMSSANPGLSVIRMSGMGQTGPWKDFVTFAPTIHALVGLTYLTNPAGRNDLGYGFSLTDHLSGLAGALAALQALEHRDRTGVGLDVDLAQYELGLGLMAPAVLDYLANGRNPEPVGNRHPFGSWAPHGIYRAKGEDRWVAIAVRGDAQWARLCEAMEREDLALDLRFATHEARLQNEDALDSYLDEWTRTRDRYEVMSILQTAGISAGAVQDAADLTTNDVDLRHSGFFTRSTNPRFGEHPVDQFPAQFNGARPDRYEPVRELGDDTFDVITELVGLPPEEIADLMRRGILI